MTILPIHPIPHDTEAIDAQVGAQLRQIRSAHDASQETIGALLGLSFQQLQKYERGHNRIGGSRLFQLCCIFGVTPNYFFEGLLESGTTQNPHLIPCARLRHFADILSQASNSQSLEMIDASLLVLSCAIQKAGMQ